MRSIHSNLTRSRRWTSNAVTPDAFSDELIAQRSIQRVDGGQNLFWDGDKGTDVFQIVTGAIRFCTVLFDGRRLVSGFAVPGEFFSLSHNGRHIYSAEAVCDCHFRRYPRSLVMEMAKIEAGPWQKIMDHLESEPWILQSEMLRLLHKNADESLAYFTLDIGQRVNPELRNGSRIRLDMSRVDIADYLGLTVETVCRSITRLTRDGPLSANGSHEFVVTDLSRLRIRAGARTRD